MKSGLKAILRPDDPQLGGAPVATDTSLKRIKRLNKERDGDLEE